MCGCVRGCVCVGVHPADAIRHSSLAQLGMDSMRMHSLSGVMQHRFHVTLFPQQLFAPETSASWITANRVPLSEQRIVDDVMHPATTPFVAAPGQYLAAALHTFWIPFEVLYCSHNSHVCC